MSYKVGEREQMILFPPSIEELVSKSDPVRVYDAFVESINVNELGIDLDYNKPGCQPYDPKTMLKLILYGYSYGTRSSRKLERATYHNISFIWLTGGLKPDHKTIANFRKNNKKILKSVIKQCALLCIKLDLIEGNVLFLDGSRFRGNASINNTWTEEKCNKYLKKLDRRIEDILSECERIDNEEQDKESLVEIREELQDKEKLMGKVKSILNELENSNSEKINSTDRDCVQVKGRQGTHAGYSGHIVVDDKYGLIVNSDVVNENHDTYQFANQINQANETVGGKCKVACSDSGYCDTDILKEVHDDGIKVIVPSQEQASEKEAGKFDRQYFKYEGDKDRYICPEGHELNFTNIDRRRGCRKYRISDKTLCLSCKHYGLCTKGKTGREVTKRFNEATREMFKKQYESIEGQKIYVRRKEKVEHPFGHIKRNLGAGSFLLRGFEGVKAEMSILASCFNIARMITIVGAKELINKLCYKSLNGWEPFVKKLKDRAFSRYVVPNFEKVALVAEFR